MIHQDMTFFMDQSLNCDIYCTIDKRNRCSLSSNNLVLLLLDGYYSLVFGQKCFSSGALPFLASISSTVGVGRGVNYLLFRIVVVK